MIGQSFPDTTTDRVHTEIASLARQFHGVSEEPVTPDVVLQHTTEAAVTLLPHVDHAGITLVHRRRRNRRPDLESTAATGPVPGHFDELQHLNGDGPCFDAIWEHHTVRVDDFTQEERWPKFVKAVLDDTPIRSVLSIRLYVSGMELGALNLQSNTANSFDEDTEDLATILATHAAIALSSARRGEQFRSALASRDIIGQAKGMIMERYDTDAVRAFDILARLSQDSNIPLADVAARLVNTDHPVGG